MSVIVLGIGENGARSVLGLPGSLASQCHESVGSPISLASSMANITTLAVLANVHFLSLSFLILSDLLGMCLGADSSVPGPVEYLSQGIQTHIPGYPLNRQLPMRTQPTAGTRCVGL